MGKMVAFLTNPGTEQPLPGSGDTEAWGGGWGAVEERELSRAFAKRLRVYPASGPAAHKHQPDWPCRL